jgi:PAS domain S-box-containing protein
MTFKTTNEKNAEALERENEVLRAKYERLQFILSHITEAYFVLDPDWRIQEINPAAEDMFERPVGSLLGKNIWEEFPQTVGQDFYRHYHQALAENRPVHFDARSVMTGRWFEVHVYPYNGWLQVQYTEITGRKLAEETLKRREAEFRASFELVGVGKAQVEPATGRFTRVNRKLCEMSGYSEAELLRMTFSELTHPDDRERDQALYQSLLRGETADWQVEKRYVCKDGRVIWVEVSGTMLRHEDGRPQWSFASIQDITDRKQSEEALRIYAERLRESNRELEQFAFIASHDLQEPLRKVQAFGSRLKERLGEDLDETSADYLNRMISATDRMQVMIRDLLSLSRVTTRGQPLEPTDLAKVVEEVCSDLDVAIHRSGALKWELYQWCGPTRSRCTSSSEFDQQCAQVPQTRNPAGCARLFPAGRQGSGDCDRRQWDRV